MRYYDNPDLSFIIFYNNMFTYLAVAQSSPSSIYYNISTPFFFKNYLIQMVIFGTFKFIYLRTIF